ncbi:MAG: RloB domain-containing protein [Cyanobacteria bacterium P01_G01_bin.39]
MVLFLHNFQQVFLLIAQLRCTPFELCFLLHFSYYSSQTHRSSYKVMLTSKLEKGYDKSDIQLYRAFEDSQEQAIENAARLWDSHNEKIVRYTDETDKLIKKHNINPSTTVHLLVEKLIKYL